MTIDVSARRTQRRLALLSVTASAVAAALLWAQATRDPAAAQLAVALIASLAAPLVAMALWRQGWFGGRHDLTAVSWLSDGRWQLVYGARWIEAALSPESRVGSRWVWLRWDTVGRVDSLLLTREDLSAADLRLLTVRLHLAAEGREPVSGRQQRSLEIPGA